MNKKKFTMVLIILAIIVLIAAGVGWYFSTQEQPTNQPVQNNPPAEVQTPSETGPLTYKNAKYGFNFSLPESWTGYSIVMETWTGRNTTSAGPQILIRHPAWTAQSPRQDIPIMIFTMAQWDLVQKEELSVSAAPIPPSELGRNGAYVFALPARYNYAFLTGFEEVQKILDKKPLRAF